MQIMNKKTLHQAALYLLTVGASITLGLLSFGGMLALWPVLPFAFGAFALSVAYEGEIYLQSIRSALNKLFDPNYIIYRRGKDYLLKNLALHLSKKDECPEFFKRYKKQCDIVFNSKDNKEAQETLTLMVEAFARRLVGEGENYTANSGDYQKELAELERWLEEKVHKIEKKNYQSQKRTWRNLKLFSGLAALFMGMGTVYLLAEAFEVIPFLAAMSFTVAAPIVLSLSILSGAAYGLLTFNAMTNLLDQMTDFKLYKRITKYFDEGKYSRAIAMSILSLALVVLAGMLTFCTAGTWMTVVRQSRPIFSIMTKFPFWIMGIVNPVITGLSSIVFNLLNTLDSLEEIDDWPSISHKWKAIRANVAKHENWLQIINPFRIMLTLVITPLRILFFLGHVFSIGLTADRVPGWSQFKSAMIGFVCEFFEDLHFFVDHDDEEQAEITHEGSNLQGDVPPIPDDKFLAFLEARLGQDHDHNHGLDLPTQLLMYGLYCSGIYWCAAKWDVKFSKSDKEPLHPLNYDQALEKHWSKPWSYKPAAASTSKTSFKQNDSPAELPASIFWFMEGALHKIQQHRNEYQAGWFRGADENKIEKLKKLEASILKQPNKSYIKKAIDDYIKENQDDASSVEFLREAFGV